MASCGAGASSNGQNVQQQIDESMRAPKRALERSTENQEPDDPKMHAARCKIAASVSVGSESIVEQNQLLQQDLPRDLQVRGRVSRIENIGIRSRPSRSPKPTTANQGSLGELPVVPRNLFPNLPPTFGGEFKVLSDFASVGVRPA